MSLSFLVGLPVSFHSIVQSARDLTCATWGQELASALRQIDERINQEDPTVTDRTRSDLGVMGRRIKDALGEVWKDRGSDVFDAGYVIIILVTRA